MAVGLSFSLPIPRVQNQQKRRRAYKKMPGSCSSLAVRIGRILVLFFQAPEKAHPHSFFLAAMKLAQVLMLQSAGSNIRKISGKPQTDTQNKAVVRFTGPWPQYGRFPPALTPSDPFSSNPVSSFLFPAGITPHAQWA
ncbi:hypothetical protein [Klebsiella pneumoniae]|uniref:hypothetical protein n=1 Tax=Klebsiella pneumoniae TaxID=573 RepID=UPI00296FBD18|nr:hypothetical protein [Klebsiella pneumoniae]